MSQNDLVLSPSATRYSATTTAPASEGPVDDRPANVESPDRWMGCMSLRDQAHELSDDWRLAHILGQKVRPESQQKCGEVETN